MAPRLNSISSFDAVHLVGSSHAPSNLPASLDTSPPSPRSSRWSSLVAEGVGNWTSEPFANFVGGNPLGLFGGDIDYDLDLMSRYGGVWLADRIIMPNHAPVGVFTEIQMRAMVTWSRWLCQENYLAIGFLDRLCDYIGPIKVQFVRRGADPGDGEKDPLAREAQNVWDEWCKANSWGEGEDDREREQDRRLLRDGEITLRLGYGDRVDDFLPWVRQIEPEQIRNPSFSPPEDMEGDWRFGVGSVWDDAEKEIGLWACYQDSGGGDGEYLRPSEYVRCKANVDRVIKRGISDFYPVEKRLQNSIGLLDNNLQTSKAQAAIAWIEKHGTGTPQDVQRTIWGNANAVAAPIYGPGVYSGAEALGINGNWSGGTGPGGWVPAQKNRAGTILNTDTLHEYEPGPVSSSESYLPIVDAVLKAVGFRWGIPDWFASGSAESFAAALVTGSPFVRSIQIRQKMKKGFVHRLAMMVISFAEESGRLKAGSSKALRAILTDEPVVIADEAKQTDINLKLLEKNLIDPQEVIKSGGREPKIVLANIAAWNKQLAEAGITPQPGAQQPGHPPQASGAEPQPAPPGSAGGDGSQPNNPFATK
jgi:hypothetical protein